MLYHKTRALDKLVQIVSMVHGEAGKRPLNDVIQTATGVIDTVNSIMIVRFFNQISCIFSVISKNPNFLIYVAVWKNFQVPKISEQLYR